MMKAVMEGKEVSKGSQTAASMQALGVYVEGRNAAYTKAHLVQNRDMFARLLQHEEERKKIERDTLAQNARHHEALCALIAATNALTLRLEQALDA